MRIISSRVKGMVGLFGTFGALSSVAGLWSIHFLLSVNRRNARSLSSFLRLERGPSFHAARKIASVSRSSCFRYRRLCASVKMSSWRNSNRYLYNVATFSFRASASAMNLPWASLMVTSFSCVTMRRSSASHCRMRSCARCQSRSFRDSRSSFPPRVPSTQIGH